MSFIKSITDFLRGSSACETPAYARPSELGRNEPCRCGSGLKYKRCCLEADLRRERDSRPMNCKST